MTSADILSLAKNTFKDDVVATLALADVYHELGDTDTEQDLRARHRPHGMATGRLRYKFRIENPHPNPLVVRIWETPHEHMIGFMVHCTYEGSSVWNFDHRDDPDVVKFAARGGYWVKRTCGGEMIDYWTGDIDNLDLIRDAHVRLLMPGERLIVEAENS